MENNILTRKKMELEKNKEVSLRIPVILNPNRVMLCIEVEKNDMNDGLLIDLIFKSTKKSTGAGSLIKVPLRINSDRNEFRLSELYLFNDENYLLLSMIANSKKEVHLSIWAK